MNEETLETENTQETPEDSTPTMEDLIAEIAALKGENARNKAALDKQLKKNGDLTKELREKRTVEENAANDAKAKAQEQEEEIALLKEELAMSKAVSRYADLGMSREMAEATAKAELSGDMDTVTANFRKLNDEALRKAKSDWLKSRKDPGTDAGGKSVTLEEFNRMNLAEKTKLKKENPELYKKLRG